MGIAARTRSATADERGAVDGRLPIELRTLRVGMRVTLLAPLASASMFVLATKARIELGTVGMVLTGIAMLAAIATLLPWDRILRRRFGIALLALWGLTALAIVSIGVWATGRAGSPLVLLYALTTVFFAVAFPPRGQIALFATSVVAYALALGPDRGPLPIVALGVLTFLAGFLVQQIRSQVRAAWRAGEESERRWALLATVSAAAREMTSSTAEADDVLITTTEAVHGLSFPAACVYVRGDDGWHVVPGGPVPDHAVPSIVLDTAASGTVDRFGKTRDTLPDFGVTVPIPTIDGIAGVLVVATGTAPGPEPEDVEVFRMLASQAGLALDTVRRFDDQRQVIERLAELDRMKNDFLSTVSHELRTPLTVISGMGRTLEHQWESLGEEIRSDFLARLNANATTLDQVISQLLDFSRLEAGQLRPEAAEIDLSLVVPAVVDRLRTLLSAHDVELDVEPNLRTVADPGLVERVIENLLSNAAKYTPPGSRVTVSAHEGGEEVIVAVSDDGPGIPEDELDRIGERFFRGGDLHTRTTRGTGLGLAVVSEILELHGSRLEVESSVGVGSRFWFRLTKGTTTDLGAVVPFRGASGPIVVGTASEGRPPALAGERFETVITAASLGVEWAIGLLYREFHPMVLRYLRARGASEPDEAAESVWRNVARGLPTFSGDEAAFRRWIFGAARSLVLPGARFDPSTADGAPMSGALARVAGLPAAHADVLLLKALGNLDADDVAVITGQEAGAVRLLEIDALRLLGDATTLTRMGEAS